MADDTPTGCVEPVAGPLGQETSSPPEDQPSSKEEKRMGVMVGQEAPDFVATAYHEGAFKNVQLSDYRGKWVFLCFYPGDFTFV